MIYEEVERSADPPAAAIVVDRLAKHHPGSIERLAEDAGLRSAIVAVAAASPWMARLCVSDPSALSVLASLDRKVDFDEAAGPGGQDLARVKRLEVLRIAARDLLDRDDLEDTCGALSNLAAELLQRCYQLTAQTSIGLAVVGMGKLGAFELNYSSDVDVMLVSPTGVTTSPELIEARPFLELARQAWRIDLDLRPEGRDGPLARTLNSYRVYWDRWAGTWEFQALLKARTVAGDPTLGAQFEAEAAARVWGRPFGADELRAVRAMKARAEAAISRRGLGDRELKRGRGGIRDIEFAVQLLQLVHGRADPALRIRPTLSALAALAEGGYVGRDDADALAVAYRFLRRVEHRLQLREDQQTHTVPVAATARGHLAKVLGYRDRADLTALAQFDGDLRRHQATVRAIHERLFFRPLMEVFTAAADRTPEGLGLGTEAITTRLAAFGFADADRTHQAVTELTRGLSRSSKLMQQSLPVLFDWLSGSPDPDLGLLGLRTLVTERHSRDLLTALCRESPLAANRLCQLLGTAPRFARDLSRNPDLLRALADGSFLEPPTRSELSERANRSIAWRSGAGAVEVGLRTFARVESLRIAARDVLDLDDVGSTGASLTDLAETVIGAALNQVAPTLPFAVIGMGRLGGRELAYGSDLDLMFVYETPAHWSDTEAAGTAERSANALVRLLSGSTPASGTYKVDTALRPQGRDGPLARSLEAYEAYYRRWAQVWERQALIRSRVIAGDEGLGARFTALVNEFVWNRPFLPEEVMEIRRTKARVESERVPPSEDPKFHLKLGPGSLSDIEWTVQLLQLTHRVVSPSTVAALRELEERRFVDGKDARTLRETYRFCELTRNRLQLIRDAPADSLPAAGPALTTLARSLGRTAPGLRGDYQRHTRQARRVVERLLFARSD
jgi:glutamate-ammonia-ligase adenylyltransferase